MIDRQRTKSFTELQKARFYDSGAEPSADGPTALVPGTRLGRYVVLYLIGGGGMGVVYAAYDPELDRKVALKLLSRQLEPEQAEALMLREAQAMARLAHPNVVTVHDVCTLGDRVFIAMEYLPGQTLKHWLTTDSRSWRQILDVFRQAGLGLAAAHAAGLVHLDFKPGNVMLTSDGGVRVLDFGLARLVPGDVSGDITGPKGDFDWLSKRPGQDTLRRIETERGMIHGTPAYLAPERIRHGSADARSDQFSFCVALYEALYGERPFPGDSLDDYLDQLRRGEVREPPPDKRVPGWLRKALLRGLRLQPEDRYSSMTRLLQALALEPRRRRRRILGAACGLLALAASGIAYLRTLPDAVPICAGAAERLAGVWDEERQAAIREAFFATETRFAEQAFASVEGVLNRYTQDWVRTHTESCEATHVRGEQSQRMLDLRMMCLDERLAEVGALTEVLTEVDARAMAKSTEAAGALSGLADCGDRIELMHWRALPAEKEVRAAMENIRAVVAGHEARERTSVSVEISVLEQAVEDARRIGYASVEAKALYLLGQKQLYVAGDAAVAEDTFEQALLAAIAGGNRVLQAQIYGALVRTVGYFQPRSEAAGWWQKVAEAALSALGPGHDDVKIEIYQALGLSALATGDSEKSEQLMSLALQTAEKAWDAQDPRLGGVLNNATLPLGPDRVDEMIHYLERALGIVENAYGRWNPIFMGPSLTNLSIAYHEAGRYDEGLAMSLRCLKIIEDFYGEHRDLIYPLINIAYSLTYYLDQPVEAENHLRRALPLLEEGFGDQHPLMGHLLTTLGDALIRQTRYDEAEKCLEQANALRQAILPAGHGDHIDTYNSLGHLALNRQRYSEALGHLQRALALVDEESLPPDGVYMSLLTRLGQTYLALGQAQKARSHLEKALESPAADRRHLSSEARFALALALAPGEPARAVELANQALRDLSGSSPMAAKRRQEIESWLQANDT